MYVYSLYVIHQCALKLHEMDQSVAFSFGAVQRPMPQHNGLPRANTMAFLAPTQWPSSRQHNVLQHIWWSLILSAQTCMLLLLLRVATVGERTCMR